MSELSVFEHGQIVGVSISKVDELFHIWRGTVLKIYTAYRKSGKASSIKSQYGRKYVLDDLDWPLLKRTVSKHKRTTATKVTAELNAEVTKPISTKQ